MTFKIELTESDFREALAINARLAIQRAQKRRRFKAWHLAFSGCLAAYFIVSIAFMGGFKAQYVGDEPFNALLIIARAFTPMIPFILLGRLQKLQGQPRSWFWLALWSLVMGALIAWPQLVRMPENPGWRDVVLAIDPAIPWIIAFTFVGGLTVQSFRRMAKTSFESQQHIRGEKSITLNHDGISIEDPLSMIHYRWPRFQRVVESKDLLLLYVSDLGFHIIPKRAIPAGQFDEFREALRNNIETRVGGFPVLPPAPLN